MKIECPVCHTEGVLQQRGNSYRVQHYQGFENGKRIYLYHKVKSMEVNGSQFLGVRKPSNSLNLENMAPPIGLGPMTNWLTARRST
jgi:hypothetical protein